MDEEEFVKFCKDIIDLPVHSHSVAAGVIERILLLTPSDRKRLSDCETECVMAVAEMGTLIVSEAEWCPQREALSQLLVEVSSSMLACKPRVANNASRAALAKLRQTICGLFRESLLARFDTPWSESAARLLQRELSSVVDTSAEFTSLAREVHRDNDTSDPASSAKSAGHMCRDAGLYVMTQSLSTGRDRSHGSTESQIATAAAALCCGLQLASSTWNRRSAKSTDSHAASCSQSQRLLERVRCSSMSSEPLQSVRKASCGALAGVLTCCMQGLLSFGERIIAVLKELSSAKATCDILVACIEASPCMCPKLCVAMTSNPTQT